MAHQRSPLAISLQCKGTKRYDYENAQVRVRSFRALQHGGIYMWTREDALLIYRALLKAAAEQHGFSAALYGSVLLGAEGNDLDVFMIPQREDPDMAGLIITLRRHMRAVTDPIAGDWNRDVIIATTIEGKQIDIQFTRL